MDSDAFEEYRKEHRLEQTDHERVWWTHSPPDDRAFDAATDLADEFPDLRIVGTESRVQLSDVKWRLGDGVLVMSFYPIRADFHTQKVKDDVRAAL